MCRPVCRDERSHTNGPSTIEDGVAVSNVFGDDPSDCLPASSRSTNKEECEEKATTVAESNKLNNPYRTFSDLLAAFLVPKVALNPWVGVSTLGQGWSWAAWAWVLLSSNVHHGICSISLSDIFNSIVSF